MAFSFLRPFHPFSLPPFPPPSLFLSAVEVRAVTLRLAGLRLGRGRAEADSLALRPRRAVQKYLPQQRGLRCSVLTFPLVTLLGPINCSIPFSPTCAASRQLSSQGPAFIYFILFFSKIQHPGDPVSGPWADLSSSERKKKSVWEPCERWMVQMR